MKRTHFGFPQDERSRQELEREGFHFMKRMTAPISKKDSSVVRVEIYMRGSEMVMKVLEPPDDARGTNRL